MNRDSFEESFRDGVGSNRGTCQCGRDFYNPDGGWDWVDGELESLEADPKAKVLDWSISWMTFEGQTYVIDCDCWHRRADQIMGFLDSHARKIAEYFRLEKERKTKEAEDMVTVEYAE